MRFTQLLDGGRRLKPLFLAFLFLTIYSTVSAQTSTTLALPVFTSSDLPQSEKGKFLDAAPPWKPSYGLQPSTTPSGVLSLTSGQWETSGPGWVLAKGSAKIADTPRGEPSYLISPSFQVPEGRQFFRYTEKYSLETNHDFGSVWIKAEDESSWRKVHTLTGVTDYRSTYLNLSPYAGKAIRMAFVLTADASVAGSGWEIGDLSVVHPHRPAPSKSAKPLGKVLETLNLILTGRETNTFPRISATVRAENIPDLTKANFTVTENDGLQNFDIVLPQGGVARPADIVFIVDNSGSMSPVQSAISNTINDFVTELFDSGINAALGLTRFGQSLGNGSPIVEGNGTLFTDPDVFLNTIFTRNTSVGGTEPGLDAIGVSVSNFNFRPNSQKIFILLTNEDNDGFTEPGDILPTLQANAITLFSIIAPFSGTSQFDYGDLASDSGGQQFDINDVANPNTLEPIIEAIEDNIATNDAYFVSYTTDNPALDGVERTVNIIATLGTETDTASFKYTPGAAPIIDLTASTIALIDSPQPMNVPVTIQATITDLSEPLVQAATLFYKPTGQSIYTALPLVNVSGDLYEAEIPAGTVQMPGVDFYLTATDGISTTSDRANSPAENPYQIAVNPNVAPVITSTPVVSLQAGDDLVVTAEIVDNTNTVAAALLFYRNVGEPLFQSVACTNTGGDTYEATVAGNLLSRSGVEYFIRATDDFGINSYFGTPDDPIRVEIISEVGVPTVLTLDPSTVTVTAGVEICIVGTVLDQFGLPLAGVEVFTEVDGVLVGSGITDGAGEVEYCFTPAASGLVTIVCYYQGGDRVTAEVTVTEPNQPAEATLTLIDAEADTALFDLMDGDVISAEDLPLSVAIRANYAPNSIGSAAFDLDGPIQYYRVENEAAYALFGNTNDDYNGRLLPPGQYQLRVTPYAQPGATGTAGNTIEVNFTVTEAPETTLTLIDADTDLDLFDLQDGDTIAVEDLPESVAIRANFRPNSIGSAAFHLDGPFRYSRVENVPAYSLFGNNDDDYVGRLLPPGDYKLEVTPYSQAGAAGVMGTTIVVNFTITIAPIREDLAVVGFTLYDATTDSPLQDLKDGDVINLDDLPNNNLTVLVTTLPDFVGSVKSELTGPLSRMQYENHRPYTLFGNNSTEFHGRKFLPGSYTLRATPYTGRSLSGIAGTPLEIHFEMIGGTESASASQSIYPMPFQGQFTVENVDGTPIKEVQVYDQNGSAMRATVQTGPRGATVILPEGPRQSMIIVRTLSEDESVKVTMVQRME